MIVLISSLNQLWQIDLFRLRKENISPDFEPVSLHLIALTFNAAVLSSWPDGSDCWTSSESTWFKFYAISMANFYQSRAIIRMSPLSQRITCWFAINTNRSVIVMKGSIWKCAANESQAKTLHFQFRAAYASEAEAELVQSYNCTSTRQSIQISSCSFAHSAV